MSLHRSRVCILAFVTCILSPWAMARSFYADVNSDGLLDEIFEVRGPQYNVNVGYSTGCYLDWTPFWLWVSPTFWTGDYYSNFNIRFSAARVPWYCFSSTYVQMIVMFQAEPGYTHDIIQDINGSDTPDLRNRQGNSYSGNGMMYVTQNMMPIPIAENLRYWVVKFAFPCTDLGNLQSGFEMAYTSDAPTTQLVSSWISSEVISGPNLDAAFDAIVARIEQLLGRSLTDNEKWRLRRYGCGDLLRIVMRQPFGIQMRYPIAKYPEKDRNWTVKAFSHYSNALAYAGCPQGTTKVYAVVQGNWANGSAPTASANGEIPIDSVTGNNYVVRMPDGSWFNLSHGLGATEDQNDRPQVGHVLPDPPPETWPDVAQMFVVICRVN